MALWVKRSNATIAENVDLLTNIKAVKKIGLVLSGGMAKGAYQIGALKAVSEFFAPGDFAYVSAASVGSLNAYAFLTEQLDKASEMWLDSTSKDHGVMVSSVMRGDYIRNSICHLVSEKAIDNNFYIPLLNIKKRVLSYCDLAGIERKNAEPYLVASISLPIFNSGVNIEGTTYFDGAMVDNIPVYPLIDKGLDYIILLYFDNRDILFESDEFDSRIIKLNFPDFSLKSSLTLTRSEVVNTMSSGYRYSKKVLEYIFKNGVENSEDVRERVRTYNSEFPVRRVLMSGDIFVRQMNKVVKKFIRAKIISNDEQLNDPMPRRRIIHAATVSSDDSTFPQP